MKRSMMFMFILAALLVLPLAVFAQVGAGGTGTVYAQGDGRAELRGSGVVDVSGNGTLVIIDHAGDASIEVTGDGRRVERGRITILHGFNGEAQVTGTGISVRLRGTDITLAAEGTGVVRLYGEGTYEFNHSSGQWSDDGVTLEMDTAGE